MKRLTVSDFFKLHNLYVDNGYVMCVMDGYSPQFKKGMFYRCQKGIIISGSSFNISSVEESHFNKMFIPLEGSPAKLTKRDRLLIKIRTNVKAPGLPL